MRPTERQPVSGAGVTILALFAAFAAAGCSDAPERSVAKAEPGAVPPAAQRSGDAQAGYELLMSGDYMSCGLPYAAWRRVAAGSSSDDTLPGRTGRNAGLPYFLSVTEDDQGTEIVTNNCLYCHAAELNGELIIGLGNETLDFTADQTALVDAVGSWVSGRQATRAWTKWAQRVGAIAPFMRTDTVGVNPAPNLTLALISHRDARTLEWSDEPLLEPPLQRPLPVSVPPWWRMAKKNAMFYNAMGRGDHARLMMMKSLVCADSVVEAQRIDAAFPDVRAFIASLAPPRYPFPIDAALAEQGKTTFETECAGCHGTYGADPEYPNRLVALDVVGTDPAYALQAYDASDRFMSWFNRSWYGELAQARPALGYIAPPLDGIWATAPFLHNGSVPTIAALLDSDARPQFWSRNPAPGQFDERQLGWFFETLPGGKDSAESEEQRRRIYDTSLFGYSNSGHEFSDELGPGAREALIEYLKTL